MRSKISSLLQGYAPVLIFAILYKLAVSIVISLFGLKFLFPTTITPVDKGFFDNFEGVYIKVY